MPLTPEEIKCIIKTMNKKNCELDPIPTSLVVSCVDELLPILTYIVNTSLSTGTFPTYLKDALIKPALKKHNLDSDILKNYRPISNLSFLSKLLEKCVHLQLSKHINDNNLHAKHQSGYREFHSCETATVKIHNDILTVCNKDSHVILLLLDLSAAFDTIDHELLLHKLETEFAIKGIPLNWFRSFLSNRSFRVKVNI